MPNQLRSGSFNVQTFSSRANITDRIESLVHGMQIVISRNPGVLVILHSSRLQIHALDVGRAADADQDRVNGHGQLVMVADQIDEF